MLDDWTLKRMKDLPGARGVRPLLDAATSREPGRDKICVGLLAEGRAHNR